MTKYIINTSGLSERECFADASKEELRVLLALISKNGNLGNDTELASLAHTSKARAVASLTFWQEAGVISEAIATPADENIREEYQNGEEPEQRLENIAKEIKNKDLASLLSECARLMDKPMLSTSEAKSIVSVYTKYELNEEYIITLAAFLKERSKLSAIKLAKDAEMLVKKGISCLEELEIYLATVASLSSAEWEYKKLLGIYGRSLSDDETKRAERWFYTYGYSEEIIGLAYSITTTATGKQEIAYMDKIITGWYEGGCKTLDDCKTQHEKFKEERRSENAPSSDSSSVKARRKQKEKPRYGNFDVSEAFARALERSYGSSDGEK